MDAIGYGCVSTAEQVKEGVSLAAQEEWVRAYCVVAGLPRIECVRDEAISAAKPKAMATPHPVES